MLQRKYAPVIQAAAQQIAAARMPARRPGQGTCLYHAAAAVKILNAAEDVDREFNLYAGRMEVQEELITFQRGVPGLYHAWAASLDGEVIADFSLYEIPGIARSLDVTLTRDVPDWNWVKVVDSPFEYEVDEWTTNLLRGVARRFLCLDSPMAGGTTLRAWAVRVRIPF